MMIYNPLEEYDQKFRNLHLEKTNSFFDHLVQKSGVDVDGNKKTVAEYNAEKEKLAKQKKRLDLLRFLRVLMCITVVLIPLVIIKTTPKIRRLREEIDTTHAKAEELLKTAHQQMAPLHSLFTDRDALDIIESTVPSLSFAPCFSVEQEANMRINYDFRDAGGNEQSTVDVLAGHYNENPFLFEKKVIHEMGSETYHGYRTIRWTETYRDSNGKIRSRTRTQTLHATVTKPKPFYRTQEILNYCAQGGPELSFSRDASRLHQKSEREIERHIKKGEKKLKKMTDKAIQQNSDFTSMSNSDFEVLFDALDRTNEVQFRTLFTPLAQTNMVDLILSKIGYGDDFNFIKAKRTNRIISNHSQGRDIKLYPSRFASYFIDEIKAKFVAENASFFKAVYFDFAPLWAIPIYQERPVHSLDPIPDQAQLYSDKECEALVNAVDARHVVHPHTKTHAILKSAFVGSSGAVDEISVIAYSYDTVKRIDVIPVLGGDGRFHNVSVPWDEYIPLTAQNNLFVADTDVLANRRMIGKRNHLYIFHEKQ